MPRTSRGSFSFAFLRSRGFVLKCPLNRIAGLLEFHQWRKFRWFLLSAYHCCDQLASLLAENLAKPLQVLEVFNCHLNPVLAECSNRALLNLSEKSGCRVSWATDSGESGYGQTPH